MVGLCEIGGCNTRGGQGLRPPMEGAIMTRGLT